MLKYVFICKNMNFRGLMINNNNNSSINVMGRINRVSIRGISNVLGGRFRQVYQICVERDRESPRMAN